MYERCVRRISHRLCACYGEARAWTASSCSARLDGIPLGPYRVHGLALEDGLPVPGLRVTGTSEQSLGSCAARACPHRDVSGPVSAPSGQILTQMWPWRASSSRRCRSHAALEGGPVSAPSTLRQAATGYRWSLCACAVARRQCRAQRRAQVGMLSLHSPNEDVHMPVCDGVG